MSKRILVILLALCLAITTMTVMVMANESDFTCVYSGEGVTITGYVGSDANVTIPSQITGYDVVAIGDYAFQSNDGITSVTIPDTVKTIGEGAFTGCGRLASVTFPDGLKEIDTGAFRGTQITSVTLSCGTTYESNSFPTGCTIIQPDHTYVNGVCSVCGASEPDYITLGSLKLHDGYYYTTDGSTETAGTPDSSVTSYAYFTNGILYLNNFSLDTASISADNDLIIDLTGTNSVATVVVQCDLTLTNTGTGTGSLTVSGSDNCGIYGIFVSNGDLTISGCTISATSSSSYQNACGIYADGDIKITNSNIETEATASPYTALGICSDSGSVTIDSSEVTAAATAASNAKAVYGIQADGNVSISDSLVVADGGIDLGGSFTVTAGTSALEVKAGAAASDATVRKYASASGTLTISNTDWNTAWAGYGYVEIALHTTHTYDAGVVTTEPTCTETGVKTYTCSVCGHSYTEAVSATGHSYTVTACDWSSDYSSATLTLTCDNCSDEQTVVATEIESEVTTVAQCEDEGAVLYTAKGTYKNVEYTYSVTVASTATGHTFGSPEIVWASDNTATATVACSECGAIEPLEVTVTSSTDSYGNTIYTATVTYNGQTYTSEQTVEAVKTTASNSDIYTTLSRIQASYTGVQAAIEKANSLTPDDYENFSAVTEAIEAVDWTLNVLNQKLVNSYAEAIEEAIENLVPVETVDIEEETIEIVDPVEAGDTDSE